MPKKKKINKIDTIQEDVVDIPEVKTQKEGKTEWVKVTTRTRDKLIK